MAEQWCKLPMAENEHYRERARVLRTLAEQAYQRRATGYKGLSAAAVERS